jgi:flagellar biosynthesis protein FliP
MSKSIRIFKSFEEQEQFHKEMMARSTPQERFKTLYQMQQMTKKFHPVTDKSRKIIIRNGHSES